MMDFISIADHSRGFLEQVLDTALRLRDQRLRGMAHDPILEGKTLAMLFEKPSLRTRVSFEVAITELGGKALSLRSDEVGLGEREAVGDVARVLEGMVHGIIARVFEHQKLVELARHADIPVINALSDDSHPCQALADVMTMIDAFGRDLGSRHVVFVGDGNNVALSLAALCGQLGMRFTLACPEGYEMDQTLLGKVQQAVPALECRTLHDPRAAVADADVIYTDTWVSMGQEQEKQKRLNAFKGYQLNRDLIAAAPDHAIVLHCLPAYRGLEITDEVIDGPASRVFPQAHNRLHAQKGLLALLFEPARVGI